MQEHWFTRECAEWYLGSVELGLDDPKMQLEYCMLASIYVAYEAAASSKYIMAASTCCLQKWYAAPRNLVFLTGYEPRAML